MSEVLTPSDEKSKIMQMRIDLTRLEEQKKKTQMELEILEHPERLRIDEIDSEIKVLKEQKKEVEAKIKSLKEERVNLREKSFSRVWTIQCTPNKEDHCEHNVGAFSTYEKAKRHFPYSGKSYDDDDNVHWSYCIIEKTPSKYDLRKLDQSPPSHFPYFGW